jgi:hypothetical protein
MSGININANRSRPMLRMKVGDGVEAASDGRL